MIALGEKGKGRSFGKTHMQLRSIKYPINVINYLHSLGYKSLIVGGVSQQAERPIIIGRHLI